VTLCVTIQTSAGPKVVEVDLRAPEAIDGRFVSLGQHPFERGRLGYVQISNMGTTGPVAADAVIFIPAAGLDPDVDGRSRKPGELAVPALAAELKRLTSEGPKRDVALTVVEAAEIGDARVRVRGDAHNLGAAVPRGFLRVATCGEMPPMPSGESGRRELAGWLAGRDNPLTARVIVNRIWHWLFGAGLVRTVDNFGTTGEAPSHPELLDDMAVGFMEEDDWSVKAAVRRIVLSRTYRLVSADDPRARAIDPENRLRWRMDRRRLDAECIRDAMLATSGQLRLEMGGPTFPMALTSDFRFEPRDDSRRSVYAPVFRNALPELFEAFDFADPSVVVGRRDVSTAAPQALYLMNHPFVLEQARHAARRLLAEASLDDQRRMVQAYRRALGRAPTEAERRLGLAFLGAAPGDGAALDPEEVWTTIFQALFASLEFRYVH
jgi:hypothetical protein